MKFSLVMLIWLSRNLPTPSTSNSSMMVPSTTGVSTEVKLLLSTLHCAIPYNYTPYLDSFITMYGYRRNITPTTPLPYHSPPLHSLFHWSIIPCLIPRPPQRENWGLDMGLDAWPHATVQDEVAQFSTNSLSIRANSDAMQVNSCTYIHRHGGGLYAFCRYSSVQCVHILKCSRMCVGIQCEASVYPPSFLSCHPISSCALRHWTSLFWRAWKIVTCMYTGRVDSTTVNNFNPLVPLEVALTL